MSVFRFIIEMSKPFRLPILGMVLTMLYVALDKNIKPYLIKKIINIVGEHNYDQVWTLVIIYSIIQCLLVASWRLVDYCNNRMFPQMKVHIARYFLQKLEHFSYNFFQSNLAGSINAKIKDAANYTPSLVVTFIYEIVQLSFMLIVSTILLSTIHIAFAIAMITWVAIFGIYSYLKMKKAVVMTNEYSNRYTQIWGNVVDFISNILAVRLFANTKYEHNRIGKKQDKYVKGSVETNEYLSRFYQVQGWIVSVYIIGCLCSMIFLHKAGSVTTGDFALLFMLNFEIIGWLYQLTHIMKDFVTNWGTVDQALSLLEHQREIEDKPNATNLVVEKGDIVFDKVKFHYKGANALFEDKSVTIKSGEKVGLVGYSGGGKTTFANLILRLYDVSAGRILIDGQDIKEVTQDSLRDAISMIPQDPSLFHRTLLQNIEYGKVGASLDEVIEAAKKAHAHDFILKLPEGYKSLVGERGVKLSGGQRQRIAIARAFLKNAPILILDEATSQLDSLTERYIQESLLELMKGKTTIVIAHRLSTLLHMDRILVFKQGHIVGDGSHDQLLKEGGLYKTLWDAQVGGFLPDEKGD